MYFWSVLFPALLGAKPSTEFLGQVTQISWMTAKGRELNTGPFSVWLSAKEGLLLQGRNSGLGRVFWPARFSWRIRQIFKSLLGQGVKFSPNCMTPVWILETINLIVFCLLINFTASTSEIFMLILDTAVLDHNGQYYAYYKINKSKFNTFDFSIISLNYWTLSWKVLEISKTFL